MIKTISTGDYPRIGDTPEQQVLRKALHRYDAGETSADDVETARRNVVRQVITEQQEHLDVITDGQVYWNDPISHFFRHCKNVEIGPLEIFFRTNRLYRKPIITGDIALQEHFLRSEYEAARTYTAKPIRVVITGPYTLAKHTEATDFRTTLEQITRELNKELQTLNDLPIDEIQLDEPSFSDRQPVWNFSTWRRYADILNQLQKGVGHSFALNPYWTNLAPEIEFVAELPVHTLHYDLANFPFDERLLQWPGNVVLGVANAEKQKPESVERVKQLIDPFLARYDRVRIAANTGLRYLPRDKAIEKMQFLQKIAEELR